MKTAHNTTVANFAWQNYNFQQYSLKYYTCIRVSDKGFTSKQRKQVIYGREKHRNRRNKSRRI